MPVGEGGYAREKFYTAVHALATGSSSIQTRLANAALSLNTLQSENLPETLQTEFADVWRELTKERAQGDEGTIAATTAQLSDEQARELAGRIVSIYTQLLGGI
jgi:hypothetical protein